MSEWQLAALRSNMARAQQLRDELAERGVYYVRHRGRSRRVDWVRLVEMYPGRTARELATMAGCDPKVHGPSLLCIAVKRGQMTRSGRPYRYYPVDVPELRAAAAAEAAE